MSIAWFIFVTLIVIGSQSYIYSKWGLSRVEYTRSFSEVAVFEGEAIKMTDEISNKKLLPIPWLRLEAKINKHLQFKGRDQTEQDHLQQSEIVHGNYHRMLFSLLPYQKIRRQQQLVCTKRGFYQFQNVDMSTGDVFGFGQTFKNIQSSAEIIVYPSLLPINDIPLPTHSWLGEVVVRRWIIEDQFLTAGVRDYAAGDPLHSINWKATARTNHVQVTKKDFSADHHLMIYINFNQTGDIWHPIIDKQLIELSLSYAATIAEFSISKGISTGFGCNSYIGRKTNETIRIEPAHGRQQLIYILETLAKLEVDANKSVNSFLKEDITRKTTGKDILIITAVVSKQMKENIYRLEELGNSVELLTLESELIDKTSNKEGEHVYS
jgi:uncharacterized protein (DUF58 family)